ncbi:glycosyltransferase family 4 protein [Micromonospora sediminimaris]|uniref:Glycogen synthase n=1 Tax=Micromonospora sediminimaris TaxID=547162 RepID=A0A9W5URS9_9ACTN|nr:glycosyltransferase family 4 protein [Micromonospora sediminimaris]GIJ34387.1 glycogen synthase [Micromonospora sediminimaris]SFD21809.1 glycogen(starch) synthase [Micromonospora sediminimaris]
MSPNADVIDINPARSQRVLMLSWEYPPVLVGGLGRHVHALSVALAAAGHQVTVVTRHTDGAPLEEYVDGVRVIRAAEDPVAFPLATNSLLAWTMAFNHTLTRAALHATSTGQYDVIHAHDWLVAHTAITLRDHLRLPLVTTIHATEAGRHQGWLPEDMNRTIHGVEHWLSNASNRVIACSGYMREQVTRLFGTPGHRVDVVPNGVDDRAWRARPRAVASARARFAGDGPLVGYAGRLVYEKGVQHLVDAVPKLRARHPGLRVLIAGDGPYRGELEDRTHQLGLAGTVRFTGFLDNTQLPAVLGATDATVVPSLYEPFGMVALEAAAAGAPLAVARTGGLAEIVEPGVTGVTFPHSDPSALAGAVGQLLGDEVFARRVARQARSMVGRRYAWATIADRTADTYAAARREHTAPQPRRVAAELPTRRQTIAIPDGNLLAVGGAAS